MKLERFVEVPMLYVNVIKGDRKLRTDKVLFEGEKMFCYVCALNTQSVLAVFVKPEALDKPGLVNAIQKIRNGNPEITPFLVCLSGPSDELENKLHKLYKEKELDFALTILPKSDAVDSFYRSFSFIKRDAGITMLIYNGRKLENILDEEESFDFLRSVSISDVRSNPTFELMMDADVQTSDVLQNVNLASSENIDALLNVSPAYKELDDAVKAMINK